MRSRAVRLVAVALAATLGWSVWATCAEAASLTPGEQMACCKNGHHTCSHHRAPSDCCTSAPHANPSTAALKASPSAPLVALEHGIVPALTTVADVWHRSPLTDTWSPPGTKHPTYLVLSVLRL